MKWRTTGLAALGLALSAAPAEAKIYCNKVITKSVALKHDLHCGFNADGSRNDGDALWVGADNITIDLNGHRLIGNEDIGAGIDTRGHRNITIRDGVIYGFYNGIVLDSPRNVTLKRLWLNGDGDAVFSAGPGTARVTHSVLCGGSEGAYFSWPEHPAVRVSWYKTKLFDDPTLCPLPPGGGF